MSAELFLMPGASPEDPVSWGLWDTEYGRVTRTGQAADMNDIASGEIDFGQPDRVVVIVPGTEVTIHQVRVPARSDAQARAALPYAIEDDLAVDVDEVHVSLGPQETGGTRTALVVARRRMDDWLAHMARAGLSADLMTPDYLAFRHDAEGAVVLTIEDRIVVTTDGPWGFAVSPDLLPLVLGPALEGRGITRIRACCSGPEMDRALTAVTDAEVEPNAPPSLSALIETAHRRGREGGGINMLDGPYGGRKGWRLDLSKWRKVAALIGLVVLSHMVLLASEAWRMDRKAEALDARTEHVFREAFPDVRRVVNVGAQLRTRLDELRAVSSGRYLQLTSALFSSLQASGQARLEAVRFDETRRELVADVSYGSYEDMEKLKASVARLNVAIEEGSARQSGGRTLGEIMMRLP